MTGVAVSSCSILRTIRLANLLKIAYAIIADEAPMEAKHQLVKDIVTFQGFYGGCNGQFMDLMRAIAGVEYNGVFSDLNPHTDAVAAVRKAVLRHVRRALLHKKLTGRVTPLVTENPENATASEGFCEGSVGDRGTPESLSDEDEDEIEVEDVENEHGK